MSLQIIETGEVIEPMSKVEAEEFTALLVKRVTAIGDEIRAQSAEVENLRRKLPSAEQHGGRIYLIRSGDSDVVKIGFAFDVEKRLRELQTGSPEKLSIVATVPGDIKTEQMLHKNYASSHIRGEWFHETPEIRCFFRGYHK